MKKRSLANYISIIGAGIILATMIIVANSDWTFAVIPFVLIVIRNLYANKTHHRVISGMLVLLTTMIIGFIFLLTKYNDPVIEIKRFMAYMGATLLAVVLNDILNYILIHKKEAEKSQ